MLANYASSSRLNRVYEQNAQHNFSVQQICCPSTTNHQHGSEQPIDTALSSFRRHSAPKSSPLAFVHGSIGTIVAGKGTDASIMCTSISHLNETIGPICEEPGW